MSKNLEDPVHAFEICTPVGILSLVGEDAALTPLWQSALWAVCPRQVIVAVRVCPNRSAIMRRTPRTLLRCRVTSRSLLNAVKLSMSLLLCYWQEFGDGEVVYEGMLSKKGRFNRGWKARHFKLMAMRDGGAQVRVPSTATSL